MRILFVTPYVPSLVRVRPYNFIKRLSRYHEITLLALAYGDEAEASAIEQLRDLCERVIILPLSKRQAVQNCCRRLLSPMPLQAAYTQLPEAKKLLSSLVEDSPFDLVHVEHIRAAHLVEGISRIPKIFDSVDCITRLLKFRLSRSVSPVKRALDYEEFMKMRSYEPRTAWAFDRIVMTSRHDKKALELLFRRYCHSSNGSGKSSDSDALGNGNGDIARVAVVPNGVDCEYFRPMAAEDSVEVVFSGRMAYYPNAQAALNFYQDVFPRIRRARPTARFKIVGSEPPDAIRKLAGDPNVEVTGYVPDLRPELASARVIVCPITIGVGIQNKVLEAMAMAKPVVASSVASRGIPGIVEGRHLITEDDPLQMSRAILDLLDNPNAAFELGRRAREFVETQYSWEAAFRQLEQVHLQAADLRGSRLAAAA